MSIFYVAAPTLYLAGSGVVIGATSVTLQTLTDIYGNVLTMTNFGSLGVCTLEPDTTNAEEFTFTGITANANNTYTLTGVKTTLAVSPYTQTSGLIRNHAGGTKCVITDGVVFWDSFTNKNNTETILGPWIFPDTGNRPALSADSDTATLAAIVTFGQLSRQAIAGAANASTVAKGLVQLPTQAQADARTTTGSTGALLALTPDVVRSTLLSDYIVDTGAANAYVIAPIPAISAYATGQIFSFRAINANTTVSTVAVSGLAAKTIKKAGGSTDLASGDIAAGMIVFIEYNATTGFFEMLNPVANAPTASPTKIKFGGTGADGALTVSSGNTNIDLGGALFVVKNYTSISITGTGSVTFTNPHASGTTIYLKSQGAVTLTSSATPMLDASGCGTAGGAHAVNAGTATVGTAATQTFAIYSTVTTSGGPAATGAANGGVSTAITNPNFYGATLRATTLGNERLPVLLVPGCGGGGASSNNNPSSPGVAGDGGNGGGALYIECAGAWNFTTANGISVAGKNGQNASGTTNAAGGGGGGAPGMFLALYNTLTANSGTINVAAGIGGTPLAGVGTAFGGAGGSSLGNAGAAGSSGTGGTAGAAVTNAATVLANTSIS